jgi:uncharacterized damage-inducible protein DinB
MVGRAGRVLIEDIIWRMDQAWSESRWQALLPHLEGLTWEEANWPPVEGRRAILQILTHLGLCKIMYWEYAFGPAKMSWPEAGANVPKEEDMEVWRTWLAAAHERFRSSVADLTDAELGEPRLHNSGESMPTRTLINIMVEHDLYHAGEINYIRGLYRVHRTGEPSSWARRPGAGE